MKLLRTMLAGAAASIGATAHAQEPMDLPPLPEAPPAASSPDQTKVSEVVPTPRPGVPTTCIPGHCVHRLAFARRRCRRHLQEVFIGYPEEFERPHLGAAVHAVNAIAVANAEAAAMILRPYDFEPGTARLKVRGGDKLREIAMRLPTSFAPVVVERSSDAALDKARRSTVVTALGSGPFPIPADRVIIGPSVSAGLGGTEAILIDGTELYRTEQAGPLVGTAVAPSTPGGTR